LSTEAAAEIAGNNALANHARVVTSQDGEDGVLEEVLRRIGVDKGWCVEFGAWDGYFHSNTWNLIRNRQWGAVLIEPIRSAYERLVETYKGCPDVYHFNEGVDVAGPSSLDAILGRTPIPVEFDLLIVDIDGNDLHVWRAFQKYRPKVVMLEFNPFIPHDVRFIKGLDEKGAASASLLADCEVAREKGYELVCVVGGNAVFVRSDYFGLFGITDNRPSAMFRSRYETKIFQGYDGTLFLAGNRKLIWLHQIDQSGKLEHVEMADADIQVLPRALRVFRPRLSYSNPYLDEHAGRLDMSRVPSNRLLTFQRNVTSECGEDGILGEIFNKLGISKGCCVDVGAHDGKAFSCTWPLLNAQGWRGVLIEKDDDAFPALRAAYQGQAGVQVLKVEITTAGASTLDAVLHDAGVAERFDFLCIDVEGNDYHLWNSLRAFRPRVVMVDFNPSISNDVIFVQEDDPEVNYGSSLRAFIELAAEKGYALAAVTTWNAIFVERSRLSQLGITDNDIDRMYYPIFEMKLFQSIDSSLRISGCDRLVRHNYVFEPEQIQAVPKNVRNPPPKPPKVGQTEKLGAVQSVFFD